MLQIANYCTFTHKNIEEYMDYIDTDTKHITPAGGNVFADLGFEPEEAAALLSESQRIIAEKLSVAAIDKSKS